MSDPDLLKKLKIRRQHVLNGAERRLDGQKDGRSIVKYITASVDEIIREGWREISPVLRSDVDLVAIGGYGRAELCPFSDWDILFLVPERYDQSVSDGISKYAQLVWDIGGKLGHSVRTIKDARQFFEANHHARTAFLESRLIEGEGHLYKELCATESAGKWNMKRRTEFCREKIEECFARRSKLGDTAFCMEPDCKNGKGALRDVSTIFWLSMAWYQVPAARQLVQEGVVTHDEFNAFVKAREFLWRVRSGLHLIAGRENDRLSFEYQLILANRFRYRDSDGRGAVERFLKKYFLNVRTIADLSDIFLLHFKELIDPIKSPKKPKVDQNGLAVSNKVIDVQDANIFEIDPLNLLRIFKEAQDNQCRLSSRALRVVRAHAKLLTGPYRVKREAGVIFLDILRSSRGVTSVLRQMHETGVLGKFCPDFRRITGHGQFDRYHHYTVDAHTITAVSYLKDFGPIVAGKAHRAFTLSLMKNLERPELLYIAVLYHDIAKGRGGDHSVLGADLARKFSLRLGLSAHDSDFVAWLVMHHLRFSKAAQHYDLNDAAVIAEFSRFVGDRERLGYLFLLTVVDVAAVGPGTLTDWKLHLFVQLFHASENFLQTGQVDIADQANRIVARKEAATALATPTERPVVLKRLETLPSTLSLHFSPTLILSICRMLEKNCGVNSKVEVEKGYTRVLTWGQDRKGLLSSLAAGFAFMNMKIITAHAYTLRDDRVLDEFHVTDSKDNPVSEESYLNRLTGVLLSILNNEVFPKVGREARPDILMKSLPVSVRPHPSAAHDVTAIEVVAPDRSGLLANLAGAVADERFVLRGANISTFGEKAVDVFFVTDNGGRKLNAEHTHRLLRALKTAAQLDA